MHAPVKTGRVILKFVLFTALCASFSISLATLACADDSKPEDKKEDVTPDEHDEDDEEEDEDTSKTNDADRFISSEAEAMVPLDSLLGGTAVWKMTPTEVEAAFKKKGFAWLDEKNKTRGIIRARRLLLKSEQEEGGKKITVFKPIRHKLTLFETPAFEAIVEFSAEKLSMVTISVWNKGDSLREILKAEYEDIVKTTVAATEKSLSVRGRNLGLDNTGAAKLSRWQWANAATMAQLEYSAGKDSSRSFVPEFVRLRLVPKAQTKLGFAAQNSPKRDSKALALRVKKTPEGDVFVEGVPMVDQGEKGYCAVASTERVMRYYGIQVDQHDLAKAADTSQYGTSPRDFEDAVHKLQGRFKIRVRDLISFDYRDYTRIIQNYNREAKKAGGRQWEPEEYYFEFNPDIMREARCRNGNYEKFRKMVTDATGRGVPLLWALSLGRYKETGLTNPQVRGGHMRTIIGFNTKTDEVIFSDSWGAGHELKRMKGRDACAATLGLYLVEPAN